MRPPVEAIINYVLTNQNDYYRIIKLLYTSSTQGTAFPRASSSTHRHGDDRHRILRVIVCV